MDIAMISLDLKQYVHHFSESYGGYQVVFKFPNNYGASIVEHSFSYGLELAVIQWQSENEDDWKLVYDTEITSDVISLTGKEEMEEVLYRIMGLK